MPREIAWMLAVLLLVSPARSLAAELSDEQVAAVKSAHQAYVDAWLAGDAEAVMATLTEDAVLLPHHGDPPLRGKTAIRQFWFPPGTPPAKVTKMVNEIAEVSGDGDLAFVWGRNELKFTYGDKTYANQGNYLSVLRRGADGRWRIARRIWNDPVPEVGTAEKQGDR